MTRAVIYARYSSDLQREDSIEDQVRVCRERIKREGWTQTSVYTDHAVSGATVLRAGYQQLLADCRAGAFDVIVTESLDRLSRDQEDVAALYKQASFADVRLLTLAEGEINELHVGVTGAMSALYLKNLAQKTHRGLEGRVRKGRSAGGKSYGYRVVRETDAHGEPIRGQRRIEEGEADVVRRIFEAFAAGKPPRAIAKDLNADGIPGPRGREWRDTTIRGHYTRRTGILNNELYIGRLIWNRQRYIKDPDTGKRVSRPNPESEWIIEDVPDLRIVDQDLWEKVEQQLLAIRSSPRAQKIQKSEFWRHRRPKHLLTGLARCGRCGGNFASVGRDYLACSVARGAGTCSNSRGIKREALENIVLDGLKDRLMAPDLVEEFVREFHAEINRRSRDGETRTEQMRRELRQVETKLKGLIDAIADGLRSEGLSEALAELERRKAELQAGIDAAPVSQPRLHPNLALIYRQKVADLHAALTMPDSRTEVIEILRGLIEEIRVSQNKDGFEIEIIGDIASMITLPDGKVTKESLSSVKVVAGVGFEPTTFRLCA